MGTQITLQDLTEDNFSAWSKMRHELWDDCDPEINARDYQSYRHKATKGSAITLVAFLEDVAIGFIEAELRQDHVPGASKRPIWYAEGIFVDEGQRRKKIGSQLVCELAKRVNATELASDCEIDHDDSRFFHEAIGFRDVERSIHFHMDCGEIGRLGE